MYAAHCHTSSVNSVAFAPYELGLVVAAASSDGSLSVLSHTPEGSWQTEKVWCRAAGVYASVAPSGRGRDRGSGSGSDRHSG